MPIRFPRNAQIHHWKTMAGTAIASNDPVLFAKAAAHLSLSDTESLLLRPPAQAEHLLAPVVLDVLIEKTKHQSGKSLRLLQIAMTVSVSAAQYVLAQSPHLSLLTNPKHDFNIKIINQPATRLPDMIAAVVPHMSQQSDHMHFWLRDLIEGFQRPDIADLILSNLPEKNQEELVRHLVSRRGECASIVHQPHTKARRQRAELAHVLSSKAAAPSPTQRHKM